ncbi:MAG: hypothetical protein HC837_03020 [Chloroflexaceae bacterium]|nr:hypothetical protein [Chloroflexaceae bacterium]
MSKADDLTKRGVAAYQAGDQGTATNLLIQATQVDPKNQKAWLWLARAVPSDHERRTCLERAIAINPYTQQGRWAQEALATLPAPRSEPLPPPPLPLEGSPLPQPTNQPTPAPPPAKTDHTPTDAHSPVATGHAQAIATQSAVQAPPRVALHPADGSAPSVDSLIGTSVVGAPARTLGEPVPPWLRDTASTVSDTKPTSSVGRPGFSERLRFRLNINKWHAKLDQWKQERQALHQERERALLALGAQTLQLAVEHVDYAETLGLLRDLQQQRVKIAHTMAYQQAIIQRQEVLQQRLQRGICDRIVHIEGQKKSLQTRLSEMMTTDDTLDPRHIVALNASMLSAGPAVVSDDGVNASTPDKNNGSSSEQAGASAPSSDTDAPADDATAAPAQASDTPAMAAADADATTVSAQASDTPATAATDADATTVSAHPSDTPVQTLLVQLDQYDQQIEQLQQQEQRVIEAIQEHVQAVQAEQQTQRQQEADIERQMPVLTATLGQQVATVRPDEPALQDMLTRIDASNQRIDQLDRDIAQLERQLAETGPLLGRHLGAIPNGYKLVIIAALLTFIAIFCHGLSLLQT